MFPSLSLFLKPQYVFIHEALNELITCGETDITAAKLRIITNRIHQNAEGKKTTGFEEQFEVPVIA